MAFDSQTRNRLARFVAEARKLITDEFTEKLQSLYGLSPSGEITLVANLRHLDEEQKATAEQVIKEINEAKIWPAPIVTEVTPLQGFYMAEDYHQEYFAHNGEQPYCQFVVAPKVAKFRAHYLEKLKKPSPATPKIRA